MTMAVASIWPPGLSISPSTIKPFSSSSFSYSTHFSSHFRCKISHNTVSVSPNGVVADRVLADILNSGVIACLRAQSAEVAIEAAREALRGGISVLEITMSTPGVFEALQYLVQEYPSASLGVGTILDRADAKAAVKLGAKFLMSPAMVKGILDDVMEGQALYIPGATTPTEILFAYNSGAKIIKVYPVSALGGVEYIAALKKPFPHIPFVASQGITIDTVDQYIARGASAVVLSDTIFDKKAMDERNFVLIRELASFAALKANKAENRGRSLVEVTVARQKGVRDLEVSFAAISDRCSICGDDNLSLDQDNS